MIEPLIPLDPLSLCKKLKIKKVISNCANKIWIFVSDSVDIEVLVDHPQILHCKLTFKELSTPFLFSFVYAKCNKREMIYLWNVIKNLALSDLS